MFITKNCVKNALKAYYGSGRIDKMVALGGYDEDGVNVTGWLYLASEEEPNDKIGYMLIFEDADGYSDDYILLVDRSEKFSDFVQKCADFYNENIEYFIEQAKERIGYTDDGWAETENDLMSWQRI